MTQTRITSLSHWGAFEAIVEGGQLTGVAPFPHDPSPSPLIDAIPEMVYSSLRIAQPMVRKGFLERREASDRSGRGYEPFVAVSWDEALDLAAAELARVRVAFGSESVLGGSYGWASAGRFHHARTQLRRFLFTSGGCVDQVNNYSFGAAQVILPHVVGSNDMAGGRNTDWDSIIAETDLFVAFGGLSPKNWAVTSGGPGEHMMEPAARAAVEAGVSFVVVSPTREDAPNWLNPEWIAARPNTDTALMLGIAHTLIDEGLCDRAFLDRYCTGYDRLRGYILGQEDGVEKTPRWAASICDVPAESIVALARRMAAARCFIAASWSLQRADHGEQPFWMTIALAAMLGQIGLPGGGYGFGFGSSNGIGNATPPVMTPTLPTGPNPAARAIPVARIADALLSPGREIDYNGTKVAYPDIRLIWWAGGNPFHHHQDLNRMERAWRRPETVIVNEIWWTPTARRADIVLPATTSLERNDIGGSSRDRFLFAMRKAIEPVGGARADYDMLSELAERLGTRESFTEDRGEMGWIRHLYETVRRDAERQQLPMPDFDRFWQDGFHEYPRPATSEVLHADFRADPKAHPLHTPSGRIELYSKKIAGFGYPDCPPHPSWLEPAEWLGAEAAVRYPLHLISSQPRRKLHSQLDAGPFSRAGKVAGREPVWINDRDAARRGIADGKVVRIFNGRGACLAGAVVTEDVRPGVVVLQTGAWFDRAEEGEPERHGNPNVLTPDHGTSALAQGSSAQSALVDIALADPEPPPVRVFEPPETVVS